MRSPILIITCATECLLRAACTDARQTRRIASHFWGSRVCTMRRKLYNNCKFLYLTENDTASGPERYWKLYRLLRKKGIVYCLAHCKQYTTICDMFSFYIVLVFKNYSKMWMKILYIYVINYTLIFHVNIVWYLVNK